MKKIFFKIALIGLISGAFTLAKTVKHFGAWILIPIAAAFVGSLFLNYLWYDYKRWCKHGKISNKRRTQNSKAKYDYYLDTWHKCFPDDSRKNTVVTYGIVFADLERINKNLNNKE